MIAMEFKSTNLFRIWSIMDCLLKIEFDKMQAKRKIMRKVSK